MTQPTNLFCMRQFKPVIIIIVVLAIGVIGWTLHRDVFRRGGAAGLMQRAQMMQAATAPPIRAGTLAPHPKWGPCTNCHSVTGAARPAPAAAVMRAATAPQIRAGTPAPHPDWGPCTRCHTVTGTAVANPAGAVIRTATAPQIRAGIPAPHPNWGPCTNCHQVLPGAPAKRVAATVPVASVAPPLGIWLRPITTATADRLGLEHADGVLVTGVYTPSPASRAGLKVGDIIRRIDNNKVESLDEALALIATKAPRTTAKLLVLRDGMERKIYVTVPDQTNAGTQAALQDNSAVGRTA